MYPPNTPFIPEDSYSLMRKMSEKTELRRLGNIAGACVIAYLAAQYALVGVVVFVSRLIGMDVFAEFNGVVMAALLLMSVFLPFFVVYLRMRPGEKAVSMPFGAPRSKPMMLAAVLAGLMFCFTGDYATSFFIHFLESAGFELMGGEFDVPTDARGLVFSVITISVIPGLAEEFAMRGVIMQPLRRFGDRFALVISSMVFALMHGNLVQIPFAFIAGIAIGYFTISTGTIWTGVIIHILNNLHSVVLTYLLQIRPPLAERVNTVVTIAVFAAGIAALIFHSLSKNKYVMRRLPSYLTDGQKTGSYVWSAMLPAIIFIFIETAATVKYVGV
ncbi:MAG: CPBP family intramembrane metalloprotease [Oscillospiraceae bacterium]|nr:CPBP family intramembrane metalloprotease [Oscillospiraceae bacterium]